MRLLLDTHAFLWFVAGDNSLSKPARAAIEDSENEKFVSVASAWEIAIKASIGKLNIDAQNVANFIDEQMEENGFDFLAISPAHAYRVASLPFHHRDPFDRLLIAQSLEEDIPLVSCESRVFTPYGTTIIW